MSQSNAERRPPQWPVGITQETLATSFTRAINVVIRSNDPEPLRTIARLLRQDHSAGAQEDDRTRQADALQQLHAECEQEAKRLCEQEASWRLAIQDVEAYMAAAVPALERGMNALNMINKRDVVEVKCLKKMPPQLEKAIAALSIVLGAEAGPAAAKSVLNDVNLLPNIFQLDTDALNDRTIARLRSITDDPSFDPDLLRKTSSFGAALCEWVRGLMAYHEVRAAVQPKKVALQQQEASLAQASAALERKRAELHQRREALAGGSGGGSGDGSGGGGGNGGSGGGSGGEGGGVSGPADAREQVRARIDAAQAALDELMQRALEAAPANNGAGARDPTLEALYAQAAAESDAGEQTAASGGQPAPSGEALRALLATWEGWGATWPGAVSAQPGSGRAVPGEVEYHPFVGEERPRVAVERRPAPGWEEACLAHARHAWARQLAATGALEKLRRAAAGAALLAEMSRASAYLRTKCEAAALCLAAWPRGNGAGELLLQPVGHEPAPAAVEMRGVAAEWWLAAANRAPFTSTRAFVEAFVKPLTRGAGCALWFYVPRAYRRAAPACFVSHAWDGSLWDIRAPADADSLWLDTIAINQHPVAAPAAATHATSSGGSGGGSGGGGGGGGGGGAASAFLDVARIGHAVESIGRTVVIAPGDCPVLPFGRAWCLYEIASTPAHRLEVRVGWGSWSLEAHEAMRRSVEALDVTRAQASSAEDKAMIDALVVRKLGDAPAASALLRAAIVGGFRAAAASALVADEPASGGGGGDDGAATAAKAEAAAFAATGIRALTDPSVVEVWR